MTRERASLIAILVLIGVAALALIFWNLFLDSSEYIATITATPSVSPGQTGLPAGRNETGLPLTVAPGFSISNFAQNLSDARDMAFDSFGNLWVSRPDRGVITMIEVKNGRAERQSDILRGLSRPHGLAFDPETPNLLYFAEENKVSKVPLYTDASPQKLIDLPPGGRHTTRSLIFGPDGKLYISIGSSCDVCVERDERRGAIYSMNKDGSDFKIFASGLRNSVFMAIHPETKNIWATEMGRDSLGDNLPPDEINVIEEGKNYGWPYCYGDRIVDPQFQNTGGRICPSTQAPRIQIQAHSAPLGLAFSPPSVNWPEIYRNSLFVAYHGSWNRSIPTGYKITRFPLRNDESAGQEEFISGWLGPAGNIYGRPAGILIKENGDMFISDDYAGRIYLVKYEGGQTERTTSAML